MAERKWEVRELNGGAVIVPTFRPRCPFCGEELVLHRFIANDAGDFKHADVHMKCPNCDWFTVFGVPLSDEEHSRLANSPYQNRIFTFDVLGLIEEEEIREKVGKRLEEWGYW